MWWCYTRAGFPRQDANVQAVRVSQWREINTVPSIVSLQHAGPAVQMILVLRIVCLNLLSSMMVSRPILVDLQK